DIYKPYIKKNVSVQNCADYMNSFGKYMDGNRQWVGCPLVVHRRCISPMFDVCNELSYNNIMRYAVAEPSKEKCRKFVYESSRWIHVTGTERGNKNHFVEAEWEVVKNIINTSIQKNSSQITNDLFIISPFKSVVNETKSMINKNFADIENINEWTDSHVGTVHTFQGKGASEVVFMLGCDASSKGAVCWVNENIVNVAVSRAKYRLYVIGDKELWYECKSMRILQHRIG
ncbi:MAG: AAA domain-containing protein, partial [Clostridia bacterium]|nr:AAA domain-containing protein [Clostridia bacterium]